MFGFFCPSWNLDLVSCLSLPHIVWICICTCLWLTLCAWGPPLNLARMHSKWKKKHKLYISIHFKMLMFSQLGHQPLLKQAVSVINIYICQHWLAGTMSGSAPPPPGRSLYKDHIQPMQSLNYEKISFVFFSCEHLEFNSTGLQSETELPDFENHRYTNCCVGVWFRWCLVMQNRMKWNCVSCQHQGGDSSDCCCRRRKRQQQRSWFKCII